MSNGLNLVAEFGCPSIAGARFLSPFPQVDVIDRFDPDYKVTYRNSQTHLLEADCANRRYRTLATFATSF